MAVNVSIRWDEKNRPTLFYVLLVIAELLLVLSWAMMRMHLIPSGPLMQSTNSSVLKILGFAVIVACLTAVRFWFDLIINAIWYKNPALSESDGHDSADEQNRSGDSSLFIRSLSDATDPILTRDRIQWNRMLPSSLGIGILVLSFFFVMKP